MSIKGFSLIEVLIFVAILISFFVVSVAVASFSLRNLKSSENKILATRYAQEGMEWLRGEKESDWTTFFGRASSSGTSYCLNSLDFNTSGDCAGNYSLASRFRRYAILKSIPLGTETGVRVDIVVEWQEAGGAVQVPINTIFGQLE